MADRYFVDTPIQGDHAQLRGAEAHHLAHVMRASAGEELVLFDGSGVEFTARIERVGRADIELTIVSRSAVDRESPVGITLGVAWPKGDRQRWLVEKAVELGVARLVPLVTERGDARQSEAGLDRLRRAVIEASKQCGRNRLMRIDLPQSLADFLASTSSGWHWIAHPGGPSCRRLLAELPLGERLPETVALAIGPEGGFTEGEIKRAATSGWRVVGLGPRILRVETAAIALAANVMLHVEENTPPMPV